MPNKITEQFSPVMHLEKQIVVIYGFLVQV